MLRIINLILFISLIAESILLIHQRFETRTLYTSVNKLYRQQVALDDEYTKIQLEYGTYTSDYIINQFSQKNISLRPITKGDIINIK